MRLGKMLKVYLATSGVADKDLASQVGVSSNTIGRLLSGEKTIKASTFARIIAWLAEDVT